MGAHTTLHISRRAALRKLRELHNDHHPSKQQIEDELANLLYDTLYNFTIVSEDNAEDDATLLGLPRDGW